MPHYKSMFDNQWLFAFDLQGKERHVQIDKVEYERPCIVRVRSTTRVGDFEVERTQLRAVGCIGREGDAC